MVNLRIFRPQTTENLMPIRDPGPHLVSAGTNNHSNKIDVATSQTSTAPGRLAGSNGARQAGKFGGAGARKVPILALVKCRINLERRVALLLFSVPKFDFFNVCHFQ